MADAPRDEAHEIDVCIGRNIARRRRVVGLTQTQLGAATGVTFQQVQKYERGVNRVSGSSLYLIARALGVHPQDLLPPADWAPRAPPEAEYRPDVIGPLGRWQVAPVDGRHLGCLASYDDGSSPAFFAVGEPVVLDRSCRVQPVFSGPSVTDYARVRAALDEAEAARGDASPTTSAQAA